MSMVLTRADFSIAQVLVWVDAWRMSTGRWPSRYSGIIPDSGGETWRRVDRALYAGQRGLPGGSSLPKLLAEQRGVRYSEALADFTEEQILAWADAWRAETGQWPSSRSGAIPGTNGESWHIIDRCLSLGRRGLAGGSSLPKLLAQRRGRPYSFPPKPPVSRNGPLPDLSEDQILAWADAWHEATQKWPTASAGLIPGTDRETWAAVNWRLKRGGRGLSGGSSLARLLVERRGLRSLATKLPELTRDTVLLWADAHFQRTGQWPSASAGPVLEAPGATWRQVSDAVRLGLRGLPPGGTLGRLLALERGVRNRRELPTLTVEQVLAWAESHHRYTGCWPTTTSGPIAEAPEETWMGINGALRHGKRGLPGSSSLAQLLTERFGMRMFSRAARLAPELILSWADEYRQRMGEPPSATSGPIPETGESWRRIDSCLRKGFRGLPGGSSLARFLRANGMPRFLRANGMPRGQPVRSPKRGSPDESDAWDKDNWEALDRDGFDSSITDGCYFWDHGASAALEPLRRMAHEAARAEQD